MLVLSRLSLLHLRVLELDKWRLRRSQNRSGEEGLIAPRARPLPHLLHAERQNEEYLAGIGTGVLARDK